MRYFQEALSINLFPLYFFTIKIYKRTFFPILKRFTKNSFKPSSFFPHFFHFYRKLFIKSVFIISPIWRLKKGSSAHIESIYFCFYHPARRSHFHNLSEIHATSIYSPHTLSSLQFRAIFLIFILPRSFLAHSWIWIKYFIPFSS